jgi:alpha-ketoglutarate-dependent taurine dioxygenase
VPLYGGDTLFANQYLAYDTLSDGMKRLLEGLHAVHGDRNDAGPFRRIMRRVQIAGDKPS